MTNRLELLMNIISDAESMAQRSFGEKYERDAFRTFDASKLIETHDALRTMRREIDNDVRDAAAELMGASYV